MSDDCAELVHDDLAHCPVGVDTYVELRRFSVAEGNRMKTIPGEVPREDLCSAHRGTGGESLSIRGRNQPSIYTCTEPVM